MRNWMKIIFKNDWNTQKRFDLNWKPLRFFLSNLWVSMSFMMFCKLYINVPNCYRFQCTPGKFNELQLGQWNTGEFRNICESSPKFNNVHRNPGKLSALQGSPSKSREIQWTLAEFRKLEGSSVNFREVLVTSGKYCYLEVSSTNYN